MSKNNENDLNGMRLDKWLWCARFFKSRSLAAAGIKSGKIKMNGATVKSSRLVQVGDTLEIYIKPYQYEISIKVLAKNRGSATQASLLYVESSESVNKRELLAGQLKSVMKLQPGDKRRPDKRARRKIIRFTRQTD